MKRLILFLTLSLLLSPLSDGLIGMDMFRFESFAKNVSSRTKKASRSKVSSKKTLKSKKTSKTTKKKKGSAKKRSYPSKKSQPRSYVSVLYNDTLTGEWIHSGKRGIIIRRDAQGIVRAMAPFKANPSVGQPYAEALNRYADSLTSEGVRVFSLIAPSQGEFYMPPQIKTNSSQDYVIREVARRYFNNDVIPVFVADTLRAHSNEDIYNRTDHHWSPLGAYYASAKLAAQLGVPFPPLEQYKVDSVRNYVGTMYKFSGDPAIKNDPETFIYFIPPGDYYAEFIDYSATNYHVTGESPAHQASLLKHYKDGSGGAYSTFLGGDSHTVRIVNRKPHSDRKLLIVKDSYGNAMAPCLLNSFEEVHVIDFRYFPHNLLDYVFENDITDLVFINVTDIAFSKKTASRFIRMLNLVEQDDNDEEEDDLNVFEEDREDEYDDDDE